MRGQLEPRSAARGDVLMLPCSRVRISAHHPVPTQIDGDVFGTTPLDIDAGTAELSLIVPNGSGNQAR
jgi:diacylglycerol kinase family enzyme